MKMKIYKVVLDNKSASPFTLFVSAKTKRGAIAAIPGYYRGYPIISVEIAK